MRKNHSDGGIKGLDTNVESMRRKKDNGRQQKKKKKLRHFLVLLVVGKTEWILVWQEIVGFLSKEKSVLGLKKNKRRKIVEVLLFCSDSWHGFLETFVNLIEGEMRVKGICDIRGICGSCSPLVNNTIKKSKCLNYSNSHFKYINKTILKY